MIVCVILAIVLALFAVIAGVIGAVNAEEGNTGVAIGAWVACVVMVILFVFLPWNFRTVDNGQIAVVKNMGKVVDTREPGLHTDFWMTTSYVKLDTKVRQIDITTQAYSHDKQTMDIQMTVQYQIKKDRAKDIVINYGTLKMLEARIQSVAVERTKSVLSVEDAASIIETRGAISVTVSEAVEVAVGDNYYVDITNVALTNIDFSDAYEQSVEQSMVAKQEVERAKAEAEKAIAAAEGQVKVAEQEAKAKLAAAEAEAKAKELAAQAEANAIAIKSLEVARMLGLTVVNGEAEIIKPDLTTEESKLIAEYLKYIEYLTAWDGKLPDTYVGSEDISTIIGAIH